MRSIALAATCLFVLLAGCAAGPSAHIQPLAEEGTAVDRRILVMLADADAGRLDLRGSRSGAYRTAHRYTARPAGIARVLDELASEYGLRPVDDWSMRSIGVHCAVFDAGPETSIDDLITRLAADLRVESAQRMHLFEVNASDAAGQWDDPYHRLQRSLEELGVMEAHRWSTGRGVRIAVVDTGVDALHPELRGQVADRRDFIGDGAADGDRHGTAVAGVIASLAGNRRGIVGVAPGAKLLALKACEQQRADGRGVCTSFSLARAIDYAITAESDVINLSLGGARDRLLERLLVEAIERNIVVVAALGESGTGATFPATMDGVIAVSGEGSQTRTASLTASALEVLTLVPPDGYDFLSGSSVAAAHVSGIVALMLERAPAMRAVEIRPLLARTSQRLEPAGKDTRAIVSACAALAEILGELVCDVDASPARAIDAAHAARRLETD